MLDTREMVARRPARIERGPAARDPSGDPSPVASGADVHPDAGNKRR